MPKKILVLGATGTTGRRVARRLIDAGHAAREASRTPVGDQIRFDWDSPATYEPAVAGVDAVYLIPPRMVEDPSAEVDNFLAVAAEAGVDRVVLVSSQGAAFPDEPEDSGRRRVEQVVRTFPGAWTILRPTGFAQNFSEGFLLPGILQANVIVSAGGDGAVALIDADDIAAVAVEALTGGDFDGQQLELTGPGPLTLAEVAETISSVSGRAVSYQPLSAEQMGGLLASNGVPADYIPMLLRDMAASAEGRGSGVSDTVARVTGREPTAFADFAEAVKEVWTQR
jgi:uncharacterized protein YbjT (DUF2867 family)